jgi:hypothetical protein
MSNEVLSGLKVLVAVATADGVVHDNERLAIENALEGLELPEGTTVESLLASSVDVDRELANIKSSEVKRQTFDSACALAYVDGEASDVERTMLEKVRQTFALGDQIAASERVKQALERAFAPLAGGEDAFAKRDLALDEEIVRFSLLGGALASISLPAFCEGIDVWNDVRLARKVGSFYGRSGDARYWKTFVNNVIGSTGSWFAVSLLARLVPSGSRVAGAYAGTAAIGKVTKLYFEKSESVSTDDLRKAFKDEKRAAGAAAKDARPQIDEKCAEIERVRAGLDADLASAKISENEYMQKLVALD